MEPVKKTPATAANILQKAQEAEARFEALLDASPDGIVITDASGRIEVFNAAAERLFGHSESAILGSSFSRLIDIGDGDDQTRLSTRSLLETLEAGLNEETGEFAARRSDGSSVPVELSVGQTRGGNPGSFIIIVRNIARRRAAAADLARSEANLSMSQRLARLGSFELT
ncbi:MAG: PAS domain-containing protein, partial [Gammaproteobacteria bacterium]